MQYLARIEMNRRDSEGDQLLRASEMAYGFSRTLRREGTEELRQMPTGVCWMETTKGAGFVMTAAKRAVLPIDPEAMIVVAGGLQILYHGFAKQ